MRVNSIRLLIDEIKKCLESENFLAALIVALTIPDICGNVLYPKDSNGIRYKKWYDSYIGRYELSSLDKDKLNGKEIPYMSGDILYKLRCAMLHEGSDDIADKINIDEFNLVYGRSSRYETKSMEQRTDFLDDGSKKEYTKEIKLNINVCYLCRKIIDASESFLKDEVNNSKIPMIQIYPEIPSIFKVKR